MFCFVARSKLKCTSPLGYCFLLVYPKKTSRRRHTVTHTHPLVFDLLSVYASLYICICLRAAADTAVSGCLDDPSTSSPTNTLNCTAAGTVSFHTSAARVLYSAYYDRRDVLGNSQDLRRLLGPSFC